ncbi:hypothetical protein SNE40_002274 [Patella caerulea]|uniref:Uncharacterized protein n=1 Tax=Patella caerulea TaxID=87958 RepID=A0AAN8K883_PATCE
MRSGNSRTSDAVPIPEKRRRTGHEINQVGPVLKSNNDIWLVGHPIENICTSTLPSRRQAYLRFRYIKQHDTNSTAAAKKYREQDPKLQKLTYDKIVAQKVMDEIEPFWRKGGYIMKDPYLCREEIIKIHNDWQYLSKSSKDTNVGPKAA